MEAKLTQLQFNDATDVKLPLAKVIMDKTLAAFMLLLTLPLTLVIPLAIKLDGLLNSQNQGPIFYQEERVSQGKNFQLVKFRILKLQAIKEIKDGGMPKKVENKPGSLTRVGYVLKKYGFDEIPQFWNILRGDMSFVGPRPKPVAEYKDEIAKGIYRRKVIKAGLTGVAQIMKGTKRTAEDELRRDLDYIHKCRTLPSWQIVLMDLKILGKTIQVVLKGTGE
jgi:lipopolysaccharide/colanic/teichoic acid biosynthesis glycosyltransferase